jgi:saccharopine dehydrogenase-like NADP-dependent oxidoreductase
LRVTVFGATGSIGRRVVSDLARQEEVEHLTLSARDEQRLLKLGSLFGGTERISTEAIDLSGASSSELKRATDEADVVVNAAGPGYLHETLVANAAIDAGASYVTLNDDVAPHDAVRARSNDASQRGVTLVGGAGVGPGLTDLLTARAAAAFDTIDEIELAIGSASGDPAGDATTLHFLYMIASQSRYVTEGRIVSDRPLRAPKYVYFPEPVGWVETFLVDHPEVATAFSKWGPRSVTFRFGLTETAAMDAARAAVALGIVRSHAGRKAFLKLAEPTRPILEQLPPRGAPWSSLRVDVRGRKDGRTSTITYGAVDHLANVASALLSYTALELGSGRVSSPGFHSMDELFQPDDVLRALAGRGVRFARLEPEDL